MSEATPLLVMLPGAYDTPDDFLAHDFDRAAQAAGFEWLAHPTDLTAIADGRLVHQLHHEVIAPARARGRQRILLGGISIGALTAMTFHDTYPGQIDALVLIAPYPGNRAITRTIEAAGGVARWPATGLATDDGELRGWRALKHLARATPPALWLGYGAEDRFAGGHRLMADTLPEAQVVTTPGGHDWATWRTLWLALLQRIPPA